MLHPSSILNEDICQLGWEVMWRYMQTVLGDASVRKRETGWKARLRARYRPAEEKGLWGYQTQQDSFVPLCYPSHQLPLPPPAWIRFSKQWRWGHLDLWVIEGEWAALSSTSAKNTSHTVTALQVGGKWLFPSMSKPKNNHQRHDLLESTRTSFPSFTMTTAKTKKTSRYLRTPPSEFHEDVKTLQDGTKKPKEAKDAMWHVGRLLIRPAIISAGSFICKRSCANLWQSYQTHFTVFSLSRSVSLSLSLES